MTDPTERDAAIRERWDAIHLRGETVVEECGCKYSEVQTILCAPHWDAFNKKLDEPEDPARIARLVNLFRNND